MPELKDPDHAARYARARQMISVQKYRAKNQRIDYVPSAAALAVINAWRAKGLNNCLAGVIDMLVLEGHRVMSGNSAALGVSKAAK